MRLNQIPDFADGIFDILVSGLGVGKAQGVMPAAVYKKRLASDKGHIFIHRLPEKIGGIHVPGKLYENKKTATGSVPGHFLGKLAVHQVQHKIPFVAVVFYNFLNLFV